MAKSANPKAVLIVEDELPFRQIYRDVLKGDGYRVIEAEDGEEALTLLKTELPDAILLDLILPKLSGYDLLLKLRSDPRTHNIPVVVYSIMNDEDSIQRALKLGAKDYAIKGATPAVEVIAKVRAVL